MCCFPHCTGRFMFQSNYSTWMSYSHCIVHPIGYSAPCTGSDVLRPSHMNVEATAYVVVDYPSVLHHMCRVGPMPCCLYSASNMSLCCLWDPWFLVGWKLAPPACPGTTGRHDFDIRSRKQFLETVDLAREYKVPICRLAIKFPSYAHCIRFVGFVHRFRSKIIGSCQNNVRADREGW